MTVKCSRGKSLEVGSVSHLVRMALDSTPMPQDILGI
jgi:hypothetical protein